MPKSIARDGLLTNPVQALGFSFYLPLMVIAATTLLKKKKLGFLLAPMMIGFAIMTNLNIISLMIVSIKLMQSDNLPLIIGFSVFTLVCLGFLWLMLKHVRGVENVKGYM